VDTVGVDGMADPFTPREVDGRLYGRGAQDMKSGVASMIAAAATLAQRWTRGRLIVACVADEEYMSAGAEAFVREYHADMAIVTEPTDLVLAVGHKGFTWIDVVAHGRAAHGSRPDEGRDAIARMGRVLGALEARDRELRARAPVAFQGTGSLHASFISGGRELSSYPDRCTMTYERRTVEGETDDVVRAEIEELLAMLRAADPEFAAEATLAGGRSPYRLDPRHPLPRAVANALQKAGRSAEPGGMSFWTDAAILAGAGIPSVLFGPGGAGLHSVEEYVTVQDLYTCRDVLTETVRTLLEAAG
jgi:acetylornithine deacetylase